MSINLPVALVEELKVWRMAFAAASGNTVSYGEMIRKMLDTLPQTEPAVADEFNRILERHPGLSERIGK